MIQYLSRLRGDSAKFRDDFGLLGKHLSGAQPSYQRIEKRPEQLGQRLLSATLLTSIRNLLNSFRMIERQANQL